MAKRNPYQVKMDQLKARILRAIPYMVTRSDQFVAFPGRTIWEADLHFDNAAQADRFCQRAQAFGHSAKMRLRIRWSRAYGGSTNGYHKTSKEVRLKLDPTKKTPPKPEKPFNAKDVKVSLKPGTMTIDQVRGAIEKFPVGKKVLAHLDGDKVDDAVMVSPDAYLRVSQAMIEMKVSFAKVSMEWVGTSRRGSWHLSYSTPRGGASENVRATNVALWMFLCTAWNIGIRGVIM